MYDQYLYPMFRDLGFDGVIQKKRFANAVLYRQDMFKLVHVNERSRVLLATLQLLRNSGAVNEMMENEQQQQQPSTFVTVANVHLEGDPAKPNERFNQMKSLLNEMQKNRKFTQESSATEQNIIICGDFNCSSDRCAIHDQLLKNGKMEKNMVDEGCLQFLLRKQLMRKQQQQEQEQEQQLQQSSDNDDETQSEHDVEDQEDEQITATSRYTKQDFVHPYRFKSAYQELHGAEPEFTFYVQGMKKDTLDYVYYSTNNGCAEAEEADAQEQQRSSARLVPISAEDPLKERGSFIETYLPNETNPSDHLPLVVTFQVMAANEKK